MKKLIASILIPLTVITGLLVGVYSYINAISVGDTKVIDQPLPQPVTAKPIVVQDAHLLAVLQSIGATNLDNLNVNYDDTYTIPSQRGYYNNSTLTVRPGMNDAQETRSLSHEYLHYIWFKIMTPNERMALSSSLETMYANDINSQPRFARYVELGRLSPTELFSVHCTESTDPYMSQDVIDACNTYIDRSKLTLVR